jgi:hypothetical protein
MIVDDLAENLAETKIEHGIEGPEKDQDRDPLDVMLEQEGPVNNSDTTRTTEPLARARPRYREVDSEEEVEKRRAVQPTKKKEAKPDAQIWGKDE